jgi:hypothetical protein
LKILKTAYILEKLKIYPDGPAARANSGKVGFSIRGLAPARPEGGPFPKTSKPRPGLA